MQGEGTPIDASTLIYLAKADAFREAHAIVGPMLVPEAVWRETVDAGERKGERDPARIRAALRDGRLRRVSLTAAERRAAVGLAARHRLGPGESQVLAAAGKRVRLLIDDGRAARVAAGLGFVPISAVFIPVLGVRENRLAPPAAIELLRRIAAVVGIRAGVLMRLETEIGRATP
jgi:predicted nucleic acid-binding protein